MAEERVENASLKHSCAGSALGSGVTSVAAEGLAEWRILAVGLGWGPRACPLVLQVLPACAVCGGAGLVCAPAWLLKTENT